MFTLANFGSILTRGAKPPTQRRKGYAVLCFMLLLLLACDPPDDDDNNKNNTSGGGNNNGGNNVPNGNISANTIEAYDADDKLIGYVTSASGYQITILSSKGYLYDIDWKGDFYENIDAYYTEANGKGTLFTTSDGGEYGKAVFSIKSKLYTYKDLNNDGTIKVDSSITAYKSVYRGEDDGIQNVDPTNGYDGSLDAGRKAALLKPITREAAGIPATIKAPIKLKPKK